MLKSFCVKTNDTRIIEYIINNLKKSKNNKIYISQKTFKIYDNVIIHYIGDKTDDFCDLLSQVLADCVKIFYEKNLIRKIINFNYFYFSHIERIEIIELCNDLLKQENTRNIVLNSSFLDYIKNNKSIILDGFINFRLKSYIRILDNFSDIAVNDFLIKREYLEFIDLLKLYINSTPSKISFVHLIYSKGESKIIDKDYNVIKVSQNISNAIYLSDISFSSNDYALNTLLNLLPEKLIIHLIDYNEDDFINTLKLIFEKRISICNDCNFCNLYKSHEISTFKP